MDSSRQSQIRGFHFLQKEQLHTHWDNTSALRFLSSFKDDAAAMSSLRQLALTGRASPANPVSDSQVLEKIAGMLTSGHLIVATARTRMNTPPHIEVIRKPVIAQPPAQAKSVESLEDDPTFTNNDSAKQVVMLKTAAVRRVPFCEECERLAKSRKSA